MMLAPQDVIRFVRDRQLSTSSWASGGMLKIRKKTHLMFGVLLGLAFVMTSIGKSQLPSEAELPGQPTRVELPSESVLPGELEVPNNNSLPSADTTDNEVPELPSEAVLPNAELPPVADPPPDRETLPEDILRLQNSEDARPWLQIISRAPLDRVRALSFADDSRHLFVAGDDKQVHVYGQAADSADFRHQRVIRWQIQRGPVGRIYCATSSGQLLAFGGYGATGTLGEISLVDARSGQLLQTLRDADFGHRQRLTSLAFSSDSDAPTLASMDQDGRLLHWQRNPDSGLWEATLLAYEAQQADQLRLERVVHPIAKLDQRRVAAPVFHGRDASRQALWRLKIYDSESDPSDLIGTESHVGLVTAMAASPDGSRLASADANSQLFLWNLATGARTRHRLDGIVSALAFSPDGESLAIGTGYAGARKLLLWNVKDPRVPKQLREESVQSDVLSCAVSPNGKHLAFSQGREVHLRNMGRRVAQQQTLSTNVLLPRRVRFANDGSYRISLSYGSPNQKTSQQIVFDPQNGQIDNLQPDESSWFEQGQRGGGWSVVTNEAKTESWLSFEGTRRGTLDLDARIAGVPTVPCWLWRDGKPWAVAVGGSANNNIFVFRLAAEGNCPLLRVYRGHTGQLTSIASSPDQRYLVSTGAEGIVRFWSLDALDQDRMTDRWGATFRQEDDQVSVASIRADGPLFFRGLREGDTINRLVQIDAVRGSVQTTSLEQPRAILESLANRDHALLTGFFGRRGRQPVLAFQSFPAWQPLANLFLNDQREWAFWTPAGVYDASFEGHKLFGWQVNRGMDLAPDFFLAAQVRRFLERPDVMRRLLSSGNLETAFDQANRTKPASWSSLLSQQHLLKPDITILKPEPGAMVTGGRFTVEARIRTQLGQNLVPPKAFVNGVVSRHLTELRTERNGDVVDTYYRWELQAPSDSQLLVQVFASTGDEVVDRKTLRLRQDIQDQTRRPRLIALAAGINRYRDPQIPQLMYAVDNARRLCEALTSNAQSLYTTSATSLADSNVSRRMWELTTDRLATEVKAQVAPDDILLLYWSGHGIRDEGSDQYYYLTAETAYRDVLASQFGDCLSLEDLERFANIPCRKLVILDTCHSGAVQPARQAELKSALRVLQDDLYLTLTATEGGQEAVESKERRLGRFTYRLIEGLDGEADRQAGNRDGIVELQELIQYVRSTVPQDAGAGQEQFPTAGPAELLELINLPLTRVRQDTAARLGDRPVTVAGVP